MTYILLGDSVQMMSTPPQVIYCNTCGLESATDAQFCQRCGNSLRLPIIQLAGARFHYAGFWIRAMAALLDFTLFFLALMPIRILLGSTTTLLGEYWQMPTQQIFHKGRLLRIAVAFALGYVYRAGMESSRFQGTLGKLALQIKVTDLEGNRISLERASIRYAAKFLSFVTLGIGYLMAGFTLQKQALHDRLAGTLVQYRNE